VNVATASPRIGRSRMRSRLGPLLSLIASLSLLMLSGCSTRRANEEQLKLLCAAPPAYLMQKAEELPSLPPGIDGRDLINADADLARRYNELADRHDALIDRIEAQQKRLNGK
jgi:hypothetical protein